jgi:hypothetical protein
MYVCMYVYVTQHNTTETLTKHNTIHRLIQAEVEAEVDAEVDAEVETHTGYAKVGMMEPMVSRVAREISRLPEEDNKLDKPLSQTDLTFLFCASRLRLKRTMSVFFLRTTRLKQQLPSAPTAVGWWKTLYFFRRYRSVTLRSFNDRRLDILKGMFVGHQYNMSTGATAAVVVVVLEEVEVEVEVEEDEDRAAGGVLGASSFRTTKIRCLATPPFASK